MHRVLFCTSEPLRHGRRLEEAMHGSRSEASQRAEQWKAFGLGGDLLEQS